MSDCCDNSKQTDSSSEATQDDRGLICYCFKKSKNELKKAVKNGEEEEFLSDIKGKMKDPGCFCETANPKGTCCLADVHAFIKEQRQKL